MGGQNRSLVAFFSSSKPMLNPELLKVPKTTVSSHSPVCAGGGLAGRVGIALICPDRNTHVVILWAGED